MSWLSEASQAVSRYPDAAGREWAAMYFCRFPYVLVNREWSDRFADWAQPQVTAMANEAGVSRAQADRVSKIFCGAAVVRLKQLAAQSPGEGTA